MVFGSGCWQTADKHLFFNVLLVAKVGSHLIRMQAWAVSEWVARATAATVAKGVLYLSA